ncbi:fused response regulator/phosphatase [Streptomyces antibioticus]|uniref:PP2C family protein-serine/threonine phosphatase n=1 Tax=Streptomyces antibioticus TaxID=1890 RepID=UPI0022538D2A|nr:fused response regulator/phosphatase [Streptomyces antibioticus]MCX5173180.1 fused response regulator/phosphatase [Streptomyces antibioticus]
MVTSEAEIVGSASPERDGPDTVWEWREPSVLLIEDDAGDALLVEELVADSALKMRLRWVRSMADARHVLAQETPDCVLLDLNLPDAHGLEAVSQVRTHADRIAVVVLTGLAEEETALAAVAAGAQDYLVKGRVEPDLFGRAVRYAIQRKQAEQAAVALQAGQMQAQENARLERGLLPRPLLRGDGIEAVARYRPGRSQALLGGDFYDIVQSTDGTLHALIGDVSGHGPDEAALGVALRIAWRTLVLSGVTGAEQVARLEEILVAERVRGEAFATLTSLTAAPGARAVRITRAGHPGMLLRSAGRVEWVEVPGGPALGVIPGLATWPVEEFAVPDGAALVLFTDGLFEGYVGRGKERLGEDGLLRLAREFAGRSPEEFVDGLIERAEGLAEAQGGLDDDVAVVHLRRHTQQTREETWEGTQERR